ncbi:MAG: hypothetical protein U1E62_05460 [Alsobacter sp.]
MTPREIWAWAEAFDLEDRRKAALLLYVTRAAYHAEKDDAQRIMEDLMGL